MDASVVLEALGLLLVILACLSRWWVRHRELVTIRRMWEVGGA